MCLPAEDTVQPGFLDFTWEIGCVRMLKKKRIKQASLFRRLLEYKCKKKKD